MPTRSTKRPLILLAEDDAALRELISRRLRTEGLDVIDVADGFELRGYLDHCGLNGHFPSPDLVLSDVRMPGPTDLGAIRERVSCPVVLMTSLVDEALSADALRVGVQMVFQKPFRLGELVLTIRCSVEDSRRAREAVPAQ